MAKIISKNKDAYFNFQIEKIWEAGIQLKGWEVKSIRQGHVNLKGAFCYFQKESLYISNWHIPLFMSVPGDPIASRKLLLHKSQLKKIQNACQAKGMTVVPTVLKWTKKSLVKLDIGIGKGKTKIDKREQIKKRDINRRIKYFV